MQTQDPLPEPLMVTITEGCRLIGLTRSKLYDLIGRGVIVAVRVDGRTMLTMDELRRFVSSLPLSEPSAAAADRAEVRSITDGRRAG